MGRLSAPGTIERPELDQNGTSGRGGWIVTVFNNDFNTWDEVVHILMLATSCDEDEANMETWEVDHLGKSVVHVASQEECQTAAGVIAQIGIRVEVSED